MFQEVVLYGIEVVRLPILTTYSFIYYRTKYLRNMLLLSVSIAEVDREGSNGSIGS